MIFDITFAGLRRHVRPYRSLWLRDIGAGRVGEGYCAKMLRKWGLGAYIRFCETNPPFRQQKEELNNCEGKEATEIFTSFRGFVWKTTTGAAVFPVFLVDCTVSDRSRNSIYVKMLRTCMLRSTTRALRRWLPQQQRRLADSARQAQHDSQKRHSSYNFAG